MERLDILFVGLALLPVAIIFIFWFVGFIEERLAVLRCRLRNRAARAMDSSVSQPTDSPLRIRIVREPL
jgi:hypothetical protein